LLHFTSLKFLTPWELLKNYFLTTKSNKMKRSVISISIFAMCMMAFLITSSFKTNSAASALKAPNFVSGESLTITSSNTTSLDGINYTGDVELDGAINASGTYVMPTQVMGWALHCTFILSLPNGTITIRMLCNMRTLNGRWTVLSGTGAYQNLSGGGSLTMPGIEEVLVGTVTGL